MTILCNRHSRPANFGEIKRDLLQYFHQHYLSKENGTLIYFTLRKVVKEFIDSRTELLDTDLYYRLRGAFSFELQSFIRSGAINRFSKRCFSVNLTTFPYQKFTRLLR